MWSDARVVLARAEARLEEVNSADLRPRVRQAGNDLRLVIKLDAVRLSRVSGGELRYYKTQAAQRYAIAFRDAGLGSVKENLDSAAARIKASSVRGELVAALDDWAVCASAEDERRWVLAVAQIADPDPTGWRQRIRDPQTWNDSRALAELAENVPVAAQPVQVLLSLGERLSLAGGNAQVFLKRVQKENPADFWANLILGDVLVVGAVPADAVGYYRAALASRPGAAVAYTSLGDALKSQRLRTEAVSYYRRAVQIEPGYPRGHTNLGNVLNEAGRVDDAIACYRTALQADPNYAWAHFHLADTLIRLGRRDEALGIIAATTSLIRRMCTSGTSCGPTWFARGGASRCLRNGKSRSRPIHPGTMPGLDMPSCACIWGARMNIRRRGRI